MIPCEENSTTFFRQLQLAEGLDLRDNRGKRHDLAVILVGVTIALLSNRDGCLSSIHRHLVNHSGKLAEVLGIEAKKPISRSQLPLVLEKVEAAIFDRLLFENYGVKLTEAEKQWFALDGKELRGSIQSGDKRGEAVVHAINHQTGEALSQEYYSGDKQSEVTIVRELLGQNGLSAQKVSLDALHCKPATLEIISQSGGKYLVGLKDNQKQLCRQIRWVVEHQAFLFKSLGIEKGHGRIEERSYEFYDILEMKKDERWNGCGLKTMIQVSRDSQELKSGK